MIKSAMPDKRFEPAAPGQLKLLRESISGHCHRVELFLHVLGLDYEKIEIHVSAGETRTDEFRKLNALMQVPVLWHGARLICDSNAILYYLAHEFEAWMWWPRDIELASQVQRWLSVAAGELLVGPVVARRITVFNRDFDQRKAIEASDRFLRFLDDHLAGRQYLVGRSPTVADIAIYTYTAHAPEGAISLAPYANVRRWLSTIEAWPSFIPMEKRGIPPPLNCG
jgi:glutathione S-transferase